MRAFYQRLFPFRFFFQWLNHSAVPGKDFAHREFAFSLQNNILVRYQSYPTHDLLRKALIKDVPPRIDIGPVYSTNPRDRKTLRKASSFVPVSRELVFDIDMNDYDDIRTCCTGAKNQLRGPTVELPKAIKKYRGKLLAHSGHPNRKMLYGLDSVHHCNGRHG